MNIVESADKYEAWLRKQLKDDFVEKDLKKKHKKMAADPFQFLRATYWRWAETIYDSGACPQLKGAPHVLAVGDIHVENFGTWRDAEGRLIWGVNDFDEAAGMPYPIDLVRLATSAVLAGVTGISSHKICASILEGYRQGIEHPKPFVLDRKNKELREVSVVSESARTEFWKKFDPTQVDKEQPKNVTPLTPAEVPPHYGKVLRRARPDASVVFRYFTRTAGTGSLGRPRIFGTGDWQGDLIVREAKALVCSGWVLAHHGSHNLRCEEIAAGRYRSPDPTYRLHGRVLVRRLSPNDFKIEAKEPAEEEKGKKKKTAKSEQENPKAVERPDLVNADMLYDMGCDLAAIHRGTRNRRKAIAADLERRKEPWLLAATGAAAKAVAREHVEWKAYRDQANDAG